MLALRSPDDLRMVMLVYQDLRQGVGVELNGKSAILSGSDEDVGNYRLDDHRPECKTRLRIEPADLSDHVGQVFIAHPANLAQGRNLALRYQIEMLDQRLHRGVETVALLELNGQTFR